VELSKCLCEKGHVLYARLNGGEADDEQSGREKPRWTEESQRQEA
jgi:hypothetical protein